MPPETSAVNPQVELLGAYLDQLRERYATIQPDESVEVEQGAIAVSPWVGERVGRFAAGESDEVDLIVTLGVALMLKCKIDLARCRSAEETRELFAIQGELMLDVAVGTTMVREVQQHIDRLLASGGVPASRNLSTFHHELRNAVIRTRKSIGESERERAAAMAEAMAPSGDGPEPARAPTLADVRSGEERRRQVRRKDEKNLRVVIAPTPARRPAFGVASMLAVLFVVLASLAWFLGQRAKEVEAIQPAVVEVGDELAMRAEITRVQDRHPHVVLTVDEAFWNARPEGERLEWLRELSRDAARGGYRGLVVREAAGRPLAEWVRGGKARLMPTEPVLR